MNRMTYVSVGHSGKSVLIAPAQLYQEIPRLPYKSIEKEKFDAIHFV